MKALFDRLILVTAFFLLPVIVLGAEYGAAGSDGSKKLGKTTVQEFKFFDINTIQCTINSAGPYCDYLRTNSSGLFWPKGSGKTAVYTAGMWVVGVHRPTGALRTAVQDYQTEYQPGPIFGTFNTTTNSGNLGDPDDQRYHIYKVVRKDSVGGNPDYDNWPGDLGAPYIDVNGNGKWDAGIDKPKLWGDQQLWCVYNDGNSTKHAKTGTTKPMGIEIQATYFGFNQPGALGNIMFMRWKIINKSDADYDSVFISMWSDTDLGGAGDDYAGVDTTRKLGYVYNATNNDATYGSHPPSDGFVFFQGPRIKNPDSTGLFEGKKIKGFYNKKATSHALYINGDPKYADPPLGSASFPDAAYGYQNGFIGATQQPFIDPTTSKPSKFVCPGDPVTGTGWLMSTIKSGGADVRSMISSGPFTLAKGDTQEIVGGFVIAQGADRLNSVELLRRYTDVAQEAFNVNFVLPSPPPSPPVVVGELANKVILNWGDPVQSAATEKYTFNGTAKQYRFEGYNVYQLGEPNSATTNFKRLATYDVIDTTVKTELDGQLDPATGLILQVPVCFGDDTGIKRFFVIDRDFLNSAPLVNGKEYYFAVTSYSWNFDPLGAPSGIPKVLENSKDPITIIPHQEMVGNLLGSGVSQTLTTNRTINGDDAVTATVINPYEVTGGFYSITFNGIPGAVTSWNLKRTGFGPDTFLVRNATNFSASDESPIIDGVLFRISSPNAGIRLDAQNPKGWSYTPLAHRWIFGQSAGFTMPSMTDADRPQTAGGLSYAGSSNGYQVGTAVKPWECKKIEVRFSNTKTQKAYRFLDNVTRFSKIADSSFIPFIINKGNGILYQDFVDVPFTVWEVDSLDGQYTPRQLNVMFKEHNDSAYDFIHRYLGNGKIDGKWMPTIGPDGGQEIVYILGSDYSATALPQYTTSPDGSGSPMNLKAYQDSVDVMYLMYLKRKDTTATFTEGDVMSITPNYPLLPTTVFTVSTPKNVVADKTMMKDGLARINIYPNPYFANNLAESSPYTRWVTISNLPEQATIRIFTLSGELLSTIQHNNKTGSERWYLRNDSGLPVASGIYLVYIEIKDVGTRILKIAVIQPEERPTRI